MHPKFAKRLAKNLADVKRKEGIIAVSAWWKDRFDHVDVEEFHQVMVEFKKLPALPPPPPKKGA